MRLDDSIKKHLDKLARICYNLFVKIFKTAMTERALTDSLQRAAFGVRR